MLRLTKFLRGCFGFAALIYGMAALGTIPALFASPFAGYVPQSSQYGIRQRLLLSVAYLIFAIPPILTVVFGMAWWSLKTARPSARRWGLAGSIALVLSSIPLGIPAWYLLTHAQSDSMLDTTIVVVVASFAFGVLGIFTFAKKDSQSSIASETPAPRVRGDGTHKIFDTLATILQIGGTWALYSWYQRWGYQQGLPSAHGLEIWVQIAVVLVCLITIHEGAHTVVGLSLGMKLRAFIVGPFQWRVEASRWKFRFRPDQVLNFSGAAGLIPVDPDQSRWNEVAMIAAGPFANLFTGGLAAYLFFSAVAQPWEPWWEYFAFYAAISVVTGVANLIPLRPESLYSDGARIYQLFRSGPVADYQRAAKSVMSTLVSPRRPRDFDIDAIQRASAHFTRGTQALLLHLWADHYFTDSGKFPEAGAALQQAEQVCEQSPAEIPADLLKAVIIDVVLLRRDAAAARLWWSGLETGKDVTINADYYLAKSAFHWAEDHISAARDAWNRGSDLLAKQPLSGIYKFDLDMFSRMNELLVEAMPDRTANSLDAAEHAASAPLPA